MKRIKHIIAGISSGAAFTMLYVLLAIELPMALGASFLSYIAFILLLGRGKTDEELRIELSGVEKAEYDKIMQEGEAKVDAIEQARKKIKNTSVQKKVSEAIQTARSIFDNLRKDPKDIRAARRFLSYYLDVTDKIIHRYVDLQQHTDIDSSEVNNTMKKIEDVLDGITATFKKQLEKMLQDDMLDIDTEIDLLKQTMKAEGLYT
jgi:5-bromo-4-chloroindolyl phosphate hydrolysis protein